MIIERIKELLSRDVVQRIIYTAGLALWTFLSWSSITTHPYASSSLGVDYFTLYFFPALILLLQIVRNNKLLWGLIFGLVTTYIVVALYTVLADAIERSGNHVKAIDWQVKDVVILLIVFGVLIIVDWIIYRIRPKKLI